jgi:hypothetical protein
MNNFTLAPPKIVTGHTASWRCVMEIAKTFGLESLPPPGG